MPDAWEKKYGLNPEDGSDSAKDEDKDGYTNVEEYINDTNPTEFVDYRKPENNVHSLHRADTIHARKKQPEATNRCGPLRTGANQVKAPKGVLPCLDHGNCAPNRNSPWIVTRQ